MCTCTFTCTCVWCAHLQACMSVDLPLEECKTKMEHMSKMFQMYATKEFVNGRDLWLAGICRYLNDAYPPLTIKVCFIKAKAKLDTNIYGRFDCE